MLDKIKKQLVVVAGLVALAAGNASAEITMPATLDFTNYDAAATLVIGGLVVIWGVRKLIKLFNRS